MIQGMFHNKPNLWLDLGLNSLSLDRVSATYVKGNHRSVGLLTYKH